MGGLTKENGRAKLKTINLKVPEDPKDNFHENTRRQGGTMQSVLLAFINSYNEDPSKFRVMLEVVE